MSSQILHIVLIIQNNLAPFIPRELDSHLDHHLTSHLLKIGLTPIIATVSLKSNKSG